MSPETSAAPPSASTTDREFPSASRIDLATCLPEVPDIDWSLLAQTPFVFLGTGAVGRPLARSLAWLGMRRASVVDRKRYKQQSVISQCDPADVDREKAVVVAEKLAASGVVTSAWPCDIDELPPGLIEPGALVVAALDNRLADVDANRLAGRMCARLVKVNVEPAYLTASVRFYDLRSPPAKVCAECQMNDAHYVQQRHPQSCDGGGPEQATGSPRPLCELAANAAALAIAQVVGSPDRWARVWNGMQWQQSLLGGNGGFSQLAAKADCRWNHAEHWENLQRLPGDPGTMTLRDVFAAANVLPDSDTCVGFSARVATAGRCAQCQKRQPTLLYWVTRLDKPIGACACGGPIFAESFSTHHALPANRLLPVLDQPLAVWGVPRLSILEIERNRHRQALLIGNA